jgi:hypothetical protein
MLTISKPLTAGSVSRYFKEEYASPGNSYFAEDGKVPGEWAGTLADELGLSGPVNAEGFARLFFADESSLTSGRQMRDFLETIGPHDRVLLVGDTRQHESVEAGRIIAGVGACPVESDFFSSAGFFEVKARPVCSFGSVFPCTCVCVR